MFNRVAIIGLGLIGGSIGLALHATKAARQVVGYDQGLGVSDQALRIGAIDQAYSALKDVVHKADLVILATPVGAMQALFQHISPALAPGVVVTDVASTKLQVVSWAEEFLPPNVSFIGGHPMAGKEVSGVKAADARLFDKCIYCVTPTTRTHPIAIAKISALIEILGARIHFLDAAEHDGQVAGVSHLPFLASIALVNTVATDASWQDASLLAATGFRDTSRLAAGSPEMYRDICLTNGQAIAHWLDEYIASLQMLREHIAAHDSNINETFARAQTLRRRWQDTQKLVE